MYRKTEKEGQKRVNYLSKPGKRVRNTIKRIRKVILSIRKIGKSIRKNLKYLINRATGTEMPFFFL